MSELDLDVVALCLYDCIVMGAGVLLVVCAFQRGLHMRSEPSFEHLSDEPRVCD